MSTFYAGTIRSVCVMLVIAAGVLSASTADPRSPWRRHIIDDAYSGADGVRLADVNHDGRADAATGWEEGGITRAYLHPGFEQVRLPWPAVTVGKTISVEDAVFADLDGDSAVDIISSCEGDTRTITIHWAPRNSDDYLNSVAWTQQVLGDSRGKMQFMYALPMVIDGKDGLDLVIGGKGARAEIGWYSIPAHARTARSDSFEYHTISPAGWIMSLIGVDMDKDGDLDILTTDRKGKLRGCRWLENPGPGPDLPHLWANRFIGGRNWECLFMAYTDIDGDSVAEALVAARLDKRSVILVYRRSAGAGDWAETQIPFPDFAGGAKAVEAGDLDGDGKAELVVSCESAAGMKRGVFGLKPSGNPSNGPWGAFDISGPDGIKFDRLELLDLDGDGDLDVMTTEESERNSATGQSGLGVIWYENPGTLSISS